MNVKAIITFLFWLCTSASFAQGFAGLGTSSEDFALPSRDTTLTFPQDHGAHPSFRIEWWYITSNLRAEDGRDFGVQWTLFRTALAPEEGTGWSAPQLWMGHAALTTKDEHFVAERLARGGIAQAGVEAAPFEAWIDDWSLKGPSFETLNMTAQGRDFSYDLDLTSNGPLVAHGTKGYSVKSAQGHASHYYSQPFYEASGHLNINDERIAVKGSAWLDREWSSQPLSEAQTGWDWFSLNFDSGAKLMGFRLREDGSAGFTAATYIAPDGTPTALPNQAFQAMPLHSQDPPTQWRVTLSQFGVDIEVRALNPHSFMTTRIPYWEGPVVITGSHTGRGYLEMTGYENQHAN